MDQRKCALAYMAGAHFLRLVCEIGNDGYVFLNSGIGKKYVGYSSAPVYRFVKCTLPLIISLNPKDITVSPR